MWCKDCHRYGNVRHKLLHKGSNFIIQKRKALLADIMKSLGYFLLLNILSCLGQTVYGNEIIHGKKVQEDSMQYMVSVQTNVGHVCGGFLINEEYVVTAAHCSGNELKYVLLGDHNLKSSKIKKVRVNSTCKPRDYVDLGHGKDIMLLRMSEKVLRSNDVKMIPLPLSEINLRDNQECSVAGWGKTESSDDSNELRMVNVSIINQQICREQWGNNLPRNVICAGGFGENKGFCQGDSGGPLVCNGRAVGVVSFNRGLNCRYPDIPNVYTDISKYLHWINKVVNEKKCI
ncbi:mast cell protease 1A-like [Poeciliopsis prolifica]|uniref:mast cell protease 1A-like n=1 Tax=Poeciliopsis prolifica TaxID=188132 RepID=UPI0024139A61|nr:mast cell protease 1A-like [Poeciliopsis prolifica]